MRDGRAQKQYFTRALMEWHQAANTRSLPWKSEADPYKIWLSEIILQQTRAQQGLPYYMRFTEAYPTVTLLANAKDEEVFRIWQGLGYYNRCKNMLATARHIAHELGGQFPASYEAILGLKGVGPYTAAAIASFAYGMPYAVVDGNVYRVLARYFGIDSPTDSADGKKQFAALAQELLDGKRSGTYNQAIMDLGAVVCKPKNPDCPICPLQKHCVAYKQEMTELLPVKTKKPTVKERHFIYFLITSGDKLWVRKREGKDIWQNLYEPYLLEQPNDNGTHDTVAAHGLKQLRTKTNPVYLGSSSQKLTHQLIHSRFYSIAAGTANLRLPADGKWVTINELNNYAFPKTIVSFLKKIFYF